MGNLQGSTRVGYSKYQTKWFSGME